MRALGASWPRLKSFTVFADGCRRPSRRSWVRGRSLRGAVLCRRATLYPPAASAAEGSPRLVHRLDALHSLCSKPLRGRLPVLCSRRRHRAVLDSWSRGFRAAVLELELPEAALSPPGRCTAEPPPEGWSSLYPYPLQTRTGLHGRSRSPSASPDVTPRHARRAREGPWRFVASSVQLYGLCGWMPKALATELGARTVASRSCAVLTWRAVPASGWRCRRQPAHCTPPSSSVTPQCSKITVLKASTRWPARALLAKALPSRSGLVVTGVPGCSS